MLACFAPAEEGFGARCKGAGYQSWMVFFLIHDRRARGFGEVATSRGHEVQRGASRAMRAGGRRREGSSSFFAMPCERFANSGDLAHPVQQIELSASLRLIHVTRPMLPI